jgi:hypothetical protein
VAQGPLNDAIFDRWHIPCELHLGPSPLWDGP